MIKNILRRLYFLMRLPLILLLRSALRPRQPAVSGVAKILVIRTDRLGDFVLSLPVFDNLRLQYPLARIDVLVKPALKEFAGSIKHISRVFVLDDMISTMRVVRNEQYDLAIDMLCDWRLKPAVLAAATAAPVCIGFKGGWRELFFSLSVDPAQGAQDMVSLHLALVAALGIPVRVREPAIDRPCERQAEPIVIAIHPGGYFPSQRWSPGRFSELARKILLSYRVELVIIGGPADTALVKEIVSAIGDRKVKSAHPAMKEFISLLSQCSLLICNNSGPLHLAAALGVPTVSMMGPTDPARFWPRGKQAVVIRKDTGLMGSITVDEVFTAVKKIMKEDYGID
jgi:ADP-heptose:LPS heptosyltransferase